MLEKIKNIADWWSVKTSNSKLSILNLFIILGLMFIIYRDGNQYRANINDCRNSYQQLLNQHNDFISRYNDYRMRTDKQIQKMQENFNDQQVKINERWLNEYQDLFEKVDRIYHERQVRK